MENKKISFGFSKIAKKSSSIPKPLKNSKELIDCLEGSEIKVKNPVIKVEKKPLVIEIKGNRNNLLGRIENQALKNKAKLEKENEDTRPDSELTIEELAARQLLREARERLTQNKETSKVHTLPLEETEGPPAGAQESSMEDYENVPINDYGMAMLRGMGWKEGMSIGKNQSNFVKPPDPEIRPKGLGLGAQKLIQMESEEVVDKNGKPLILAKDAFAKITAGPHRGTYCIVQGLDDEAGRVIVKLNKTDAILTLNELFVKPVTKEDYTLGSKVINNAQYEQYKEDDVKPKNGSKSSKSEKIRVKSEKYSDSDDSYSKDESYSKSSRYVKKRDSSSEYDKKKSKNGKKHSSSVDENCTKSSKDKYKTSRNSRREDSSSEDSDKRRRHSSSEDFDKKKSSRNGDSRDSRRKDLSSEASRRRSRRASSSDDSDRARSKGSRKRASSSEDSERGRTTEIKRRDSNSEDSDRKRTKNSRRDLSSEDSNRKRSKDSRRRAKNSEDSNKRKPNKDSKRRESSSESDGKEYTKVKNRSSKSKHKSEKYKR